MIFGVQDRFGPADNILRCFKVRDLRNRFGFVRRPRYVFKNCPVTKMITRRPIHRTIITPGIRTDQFHRHGFVRQC